MKSIKQVLIPLSVFVAFALAAPSAEEARDEPMRDNDNSYRDMDGLQTVKAPKLKKHYGGYGLVSFPEHIAGLYMQ